MIEAKNFNKIRTNLEGRSPSALRRLGAQLERRMEELSFASRSGGLEEFRLNTLRMTDVRVARSLLHRASRVVFEHDPIAWYEARVEGENRE